MRGALRNIDITHSCGRADVVVNRKQHMHADAIKNIEWITYRATAFYVI
jgi:hypothetical protein